MIITVRKRSLRRLCFYTCLLFCSQGGSICLCACWDTTATPGSRNPLEQTPPPEQTPPEQTPPEQTSLGDQAHTRLKQTPPRAEPPGPGTLPEQTPPTPQTRHPPREQRRILLRTVRILLECILVLSAVAWTWDGVNCSWIAQPISTFADSYGAREWRPIVPRAADGTECTCAFVSMTIEKTAFRSIQWVSP